MTFLIVAAPRTGSTLLTKALHPHCDNEIWYSPNVKNRGWTFERSRSQPLQYFRSWKGEGAKVFYIQLDQMKAHAVNLFSNIDCAIFLRRKNLTEQAISLKMAESFGYHRRQKAPIEKSKIELSISELKELSDFWFGRYYKWREFADDKCRIMDLWYEDLDLDYVESVSFVRDFLGLGGTVPKSAFVKLRSPNRYRTVISNYDEIVQEMGETYGVPFGKPSVLWKDLK